MEVMTMKIYVGNLSFEASDQDLKEAAQKKQAYFEKQDLELIDPRRGEVVQFKQAQNE